MRDGRMRGGEDEGGSEAGREMKEVVRQGE